MIPRFGDVDFRLRGGCLGDLALDGLTFLLGLDLRGREVIAPTQKHDHRKNDGDEHVDLVIGLLALHLGLGSTNASRAFCCL